jgi:hypothetical protein
MFALAVSNNDLPDNFILLSIYVCDLDDRPTPRFGHLRGAILVAMWLDPGEAGDRP